jgi:hypothetical protein
MKSDNPRKKPSSTAMLSTSGNGLPNSVMQGRDYPIHPVPFRHVRITGGFWAPILRTNRRETLPFIFQKCEEYGRVSNFELASRLKSGEHRGFYPFDDTDLYKVLEGASYSIAIHPDPQMESYLDHLIAIIAAAQEKDGYLFTPLTNNCERLRHRIGRARWEKLAEGSHELYCCGHLFEAAVAHYRATGKPSLLDVAIRNADLLVREFGPGKNETAPDHPIVEMALARLYRVTGNPAYLNLAVFFLEKRGPGGPEYQQSHLRVADQREAVGHAVRASYLYSGMADAAALTGRHPEYIEALEAIWRNVVERKLYITGGIGARHGGECFGEDYELPNASAYCESCASIANVFWNSRMFLLHGDSFYFDVLERTLYNALLAGYSQTGREFFYPNPLESFGQYKRGAWFGCSCCPTNFVRFIPSLSGYVYAFRGRDLYVNLFIQSLGRISLPDGTVHLEQKTRYPWDEVVQIIVNPENEGVFSILVRIPGWARNQPVPGSLYRYEDSAQSGGNGLSLSVNDKDVPVSLDRGYARIERHWKQGDVINLRLPMPIRRVVCSEEVAGNIGKVAIERGPIVYCVEGADVEDGYVFNMVLPDSAELHNEFDPDFLGGVETVRGRALVLTQEDLDKPPLSRAIPFQAIPYYAWAHRGAHKMAVWLPRNPQSALPLPAWNKKRIRRITLSPNADPQSPFYRWILNGTESAWIQYDFTSPRLVSSSKVYWFDDTDNRDQSFPRKWRLLYRSGESWEPVSARNEYAIERDRFNEVFFQPVQTDALRLELELPGVSGGVIEWLFD